VTEFVHIAAAGRRLAAPGTPRTPVRRPPV
jgi:hypothetical protein